MTAEELFESIGTLDEELIGNTEIILRKVKFRGIITKITSCAAASVALMVLPFAILALTPAGSAGPNNTGGADGGKTSTAVPSDNNGASPVSPIWMYEINGLYYEVCENTDVLSAYGIEKPADISMAGEYIGEFDNGSSYSVAKVYRLKDIETEELLLVEIEGDMYYLVSGEGNQ